MPSPTRSRPPAGPATKPALRERMWARLEREQVGRFPLPLTDRIPNFAGAAEAAVDELQHRINERSRQVPDVHKTVDGEISRPPRQEPGNSADERGTANCDGGVTAQHIRHERSVQNVRHYRRPDDRHLAIDAREAMHEYLTLFYRLGRAARALEAVVLGAPVEYRGMSMTPLLDATFHKITADVSRITQMQKKKISEILSTDHGSM